MTRPALAQTDPDLFFREMEGGIHPGTVAAADAAQGTKALRPATCWRDLLTVGDEPRDREFWAVTDEGFFYFVRYWDEATRNWGDLSFSDDEGNLRPAADFIGWTDKYHLAQIAAAEQRKAHKAECAAFKATLPPDATVFRGAGQ